MHNDSAIATCLDAEGFNKHIEALTPSQKAFAHLLTDWIERPCNSVILVSGGPGTGKTYVVTRTLEYFNTNQIRMAFTARIAQKIKGRTLHSYLKLNWSEGSVFRKLEEELEDETDFSKCIEKSKILLDEFSCAEKPAIIVIDEIGMVPYWLSYWIIQYFFKRSKTPILFVAMGDSHQLRPVKSNNNLFGLECLDTTFKTHRIVLTESKRFCPEYEPIVRQLCEFVDNNDETGLLGFVCQHFPIVESIDSDMLKQCTRALAFLNSTVDYYNKYFIENIYKGQITRLYKRDFKNNVMIKTVYTDVRENCRIFVTKNGCANAINGTPLIFNRYCSKRDVLECTHLNTGELVNVYRDHNTGMFPIALGFAGTVHKFQGETIDDEAIVINFDGSRDLNLLYTALSRVRTIKQILAIAL